MQTSQGIPLGRLSLSQALREAYPGAIYYYMGNAHRVYRFDYRGQLIFVRRERKWQTKPDGNTKAFPRFDSGILQLRANDNMLVSECQLQVSERVVGFTERRGGAEAERFKYGPESPYFPRDLSRFFETTGVLWWSQLAECSEEFAELVLDTFCDVRGIQHRDLGVASFFAMRGPLSPEKVQGFCVFDDVAGSLRLSQGLAAEFEVILEAARESAISQGRRHLIGMLDSWLEIVPGLSNRVQSLTMSDFASDNWVEVIADYQPAIYTTDDGPIDVEVIGHRYTPQGLMYTLLHNETKLWAVREDLIHPINGLTKVVRTNLITGEIREIDVTAQVNSQRVVQDCS